MSSNPHYQGQEQALGPKEIIDGIVKVNPVNLSVVWGNDNRYWKIPKNDSEPLELLQVCWLEVTGSVDDLDLEKRYEVGFNLSFTPDAFGWGGGHLFVMAMRGKNGKKTWKKVPLDEYNNKTDPFDIKGKILETNSDQKDKTIYFGLYEVWTGKWKGGLKIHHAFVRDADHNKITSIHLAE